MEAAVLGSSGYVGEVLCGLIARHPCLELGARVSGSELTKLRSVDSATQYDHSPIRAAIGGAEVVFLALPHGVSQEVVPEVFEEGLQIVDLGADFRFPDRDRYERWYGGEHRASELLGKACFGLVELYREQVQGSPFIAIPGCYVTAAVLALAPMVRLDLDDGGLVIVDGYSGVSGAGKSPTATTHFVTVNESLVAYGVGGHRHTGEMEMALGRTVLFTPHLAPITRGILTTSYVAPAPDRAPVRGEELLVAYREFYAGDRFVQIVASPPATRHTYGTNDVLIYPFFDERTSRYIVVAALDNLVKGAAGQAVQACNVARGWEESLGLEGLGVWP